MKPVAVILSRYNSSRLPGKVLKVLEGLPLVEHIINRLSIALPIEQIVLATSVEPSDDPIERFAKSNGICCFRGSLNNVSERFMKAAENASADWAIRINGDNLFIDLEAFNEMLSISLSGNYDFVTNVPGRTFPYGMSIEMVNLQFYQHLLEEMDTPRWQEHVTLYLYETEKGKQFHFKNRTCPQMKGKKLAIDTTEDFEQAKKYWQCLRPDFYNYDLCKLSKRLEETR
jgi:spore coat polysaccharide biosynthesis protein SpsF